MILFLYNKLLNDKKLIINSFQAKIIDNIFGLKIIEIKNKIIKYKKTDLFLILLNLYI